ncbi:hypothetical protein [Shewanella xiamenensis]|uniref:hypothetical protein n=1 Tax=Shewanella xiamenensis TaxID=332186 RepID=UPI00313D7B9C
MIVLRATILFYIFYGALLFVAPLKNQYMDLLPGYILSCFIFFPIFLGVLSTQLITKKLGRNGGNNKIFHEFNHVFVLLESRLNLLMIFAFFSIPASLYATNFYTGLNPVELFLKVFLESKSSYNDYQSYFQENNLGAFSISKLPAILSNTFVKLLVIVNFYILYMVDSVFTRKRFKLSLFLSLVSFVYFSIARGTSFEFFELIALNLFLILYSSNMTIKKFAFSKKFFKLIIFSIFCLLVYSFNISMRYSGGYVPGCHSAIFCYQENNMLPDGIALILFKISGYFVFGFYYLSQFINYVIYESGDFFVFLFTSMAVLDSQVTSRFLCESHFDCQAMWSPSLETWSIDYGFLTTILLIYFFVLLATLTYRARHVVGYFSVFVINYTIFLQFIAFPVGNFVGTSSATKLILLGSILFVFSKLIFHLLSRVKNNAR